MGQMVGMISVRKIIHLSTSIFVSIIFNHSFAELFISYESVMDTLEELLLALLLQLVGNITFPISPLVTISMSVRSSFSSWRSRELKEDPSCTWWMSDFLLGLYARSARTCKRQYQCPSMINILCTALWVPSRAIRTIRCSQLHESFVLILDWRDKNDWFCRKSCWRACRFGWFSIFWINSWMLVLCACFTTECGSRGIRKSVSASILSRIVSLSMLGVSASWYTSGSSCAATVSLTSRPVLSWVCSTLRLLLSSDEHAWTLITSCVIPGRSDLSEEQSSSLKEFTLISWERYVFLSSWTLITSCVIPSRPDLSRIGFGIGWVGWKNFACRAISPPGCRAISPSGCRATSPSGCRATFEPNSFVQLWRSEIFGGGRGDMCAFSYKTSPVFNLTTFGIQ